MTIKPLPPESTTPASFKTGSKLGVLSNDFCPTSRQALKNSTVSSNFLWDFSAYSAISLITVNIVPSVGFITALYATSFALVNAWLIVLTSIVFLSAMPCESPRKIWDKITPEFPLAPIRAPLLNAFAISPQLSLSSERACSLADFIVKNILIPVSPSGTGKTLRALTKSLFTSRLATAFLMPFLNIFASIYFIIPPICSFLFLEQISLHPWLLDQFAFQH